LYETELIKGKIIKGVGGFYYVLDEKSRIHECKARGRFRKDGQTPLPGDDVLFMPQEDAYGYIDEMLERRNVLVRPRVANVDMAAIIVSADKPEIDYLLCDKLLISINREGIVPLIIINKCDLADEAKPGLIEDAYRNVCQTLCVSAKRGDGLGLLKQRLMGKCTVFAGQSAAGKSSLINALFDELDLETGGLSKKTARGKHTTRHAELLVQSGFSGIVVDTPGFSSFDSGDLLPEQLSDYYEDFHPYLDGCRFGSCLHAEEPDCGVKDAVCNGQINDGRYARYLTILKELQEKRLRRYD
jgi:ribosome biogenesis GTPase